MHEQMNPEILGQETKCCAMASGGKQHRTHKRLRLKREPRSGTEGSHQVFGACFPGSSDSRGLKERVGREGTTLGEAAM